MVNLKMKIAAVTIILALATLALNAYSANADSVSTFLPGDVNHDGVVDVKDVALFGMSWYASVGQPNYNPNCDFNHSGRVDVSDAAILGLYYGSRSIQAQVSITPTTLNLKSQGKWVMCRISLPQDMNASAINATMLKLNGTIAAQEVELSENNDLLLKFSRSEVITLIQNQLKPADDGKFVDVTLTIGGHVSSKVWLLGSDTIRAIHFD